MPGIVGLTSAYEGSQLPPMEEALFKTPCLSYQRCEELGESWGVMSLSRDRAFVQHRNVKLAFEGYLTNTEKSGKELLVWIIDLFLDNGKEFARELSGSFQIVIKYKDKTYLYADHTCSRPLFFMQKPGILYFSPEIAPLMVHQKRADLDEANLIQFLVAGHFFSGHTLAKQIQCLKPGEFLIFDKGAIKRKQYYVYKVAPDRAFDKHEAIKRLGRQLKEAITSQWHRAENPGILLSGGVDSRYIFHTIADYVDDTTKLKTICWGEDFKRKGADIEISSRIAKRFGTQHIIIERRTQNFESDFPQMFLAQSGMTDGAIIHADELRVCRDLREEYGINALFRGDHAFGGSAERSTIQHGLLDLGMTLTQHLASRDRWFDKQTKRIFHSHSDMVSSLFPQEEVCPSDMRDTLRSSERVPAYLHQLNYFKYHYLDVYNPFLGKRVLDISKTIPSHYRAKKKLLKECYRKSFAKRLDIPFAYKDNMINWNQAIVKSPQLYAFLQESINQLPGFFNKTYFHNCLSFIKYNASTKAMGRSRHLAKRMVKSLPIPKSFVEKLRGKEHVISPSVLILRLVVLSRWFRLWIN